jgi:ADP-heptose:LPS heptosyltransferase
VAVAEKRPVVALGPSNIGDALLCLPALTRLARSLNDAPVVLYLGPRAYGALKDLLPGMTLREFPRPKTFGQWRAFIGELRQWRSVRFVDFRRSMVGLFIRPAEALFGKPGWRKWLLPANKGQAGQSYGILAGQGAVLAESIQPEDYPLIVPVAAGARMENELGQNVRPIVMLQLGASHPPKRYPVKLWEELARLWTGKGWQVVWTGVAEPHEKPAAVPGGSVDLVNRTTFAELAALMKLSRLVLSNDSGPMHLAAALGVPVVGLFGQTNGERYGPFAPWGVALQSSVECSPCNAPTCRFGEPFCLDEVTPDQVTQAAEALLQRLGILA